LRNGISKLIQRCFNLQDAHCQQKQYYLKTKKPTANQNGEWQNFFNDKVQFCDSVTVQSWAIIFPERNEKDARSFAETLNTNGTPFGMKFPSAPVVVPLKNEDVSNYLEAIRKNAQCSFIACILPTNARPRYIAIKSEANKCGVLTQCVFLRNLTKGDKHLNNVCTKVAQQINSKLGGNLWRVTIPFDRSRFMVCGIDISHNKKAAKPSVFAFTASMNKTATQYWTKVKFDPKGQELQSKLRPCMVEALKRFGAATGGLPDFIFCYRDGVGTGQLDAVRDFEIPQLLGAFTDFPNYNPRFAFVIVTKRINARFFTDNNKNPPAGTVVDTGVVSAPGGSVLNTEFEFFLVAQNTRKGTVSPTHYHVLKDTTGLSADQIQIWTFKLCHLYYNYAGAICVPAPIQYADRAALLHSTSQIEDTNSGFKTLYYL